MARALSTKNNVRSRHIEGDINENHEQKRKSEKPRFFGQNKLLF